MSAAGSSTPGPSSMALGGLGGSLECADGDLLCPVCFELIEEAYVTRCGHSFCYACIAKSVELHRRCPKCGAGLVNRDQIFPNFLLNELVAKRRQSASDPLPVTPDSTQSLRATLSREAKRLPLPDVDVMLQLLQRRKRALETQSATAQHRLLHEFLSQLHHQKSQQLEQVAREAALVEKDMEHVASILRELNASAPDGDAMDDANDDVTLLNVTSEQCETFANNVSVTPSADEALQARWRRLHEHMDDFIQCYFQHRADELFFPCDPSSSGGGVGSGGGGVNVSNSAVDSPPVIANTPGDARVPVAGDTSPALSVVTPCETYSTTRARGLAAFGHDLAAFTRYRTLRPLATLHYCSDAINYSTIVSTIEFDKDDEFFAIAGVTKRIKVFELAAVARDAVDVHYPCAEMQCAHKVSSVSWNKYHKNVLASADYEGTVSIWDAHTGQRTRAFQEHDKRCWSVHFNRCDVRLLASGSDDARVKLWALNTDRCVHTLEAKFNVCCVRFNPRSSCHLAFGSADHCVHYYDLRAPRQPLAVFKDHRKAVSYVKFLDARTLVSASTDSQLKLWHVESPRCQRSFTGHTNEKNFVGLATDGQYIACGSENNALYVYYAGLAKPLLQYRFEAARGLLERERRDDEPAEFVSAVCWRRSADRPLLLAANSQGTIKVLELL